jgi:hypothetical protein
MSTKQTKTAGSTKTKTQSTRKESHAMPKKTKTPKAATHAVPSTTQEPSTLKESTTMSIEPNNVQTIVTQAAPSPAQPQSPLSPKTGIALVFLPPPPADAKIPAPPPGTDAPGGQNFRAVVPKKLELAALAGAVADLKRCTNYAQIFGSTGIPYEQAVQAFDVGNQWSTMRNETDAWDKFCQTQEGISWATIRAMMVALKAAFDVAVLGDASLLSAMPSLAALFGAKKAIAKKAAAVKKLNRQAIAKGEPPIHGVVGKKRLKRTEKAAVGGVNASTAAPAASVAPVAVAPAPAPAPAPAAVVATTAAPAATNGAGP